MSCPALQLATRKPKRSRFSKTNALQRYKGSLLIEILREHQREFPRFAPYLEQAVERIASQAERTRASDRQKVLTVLKEWSEGVYLNDIVDDTNLSQWDVRQILADLVKKGHVIEKPEPRPKLSPACWRVIYCLKG